MHVVCGREIELGTPWTVSSKCCNKYNFRDGGMIFLGEDLLKQRIWNRQIYKYKTRNLGED